jgi:hypothetical protein
MNRTWQKMDEEKDEEWVERKRCRKEQQLHHPPHQ